MKVYVVYQLGYGQEICLDFLEIYEDYKMAEAKYLKEIENNVKDYDFVIDEECNDRRVKMEYRTTRLFRFQQENWDNYLEIYIEEKEVQ